MINLRRSFVLKTQCMTQLTKECMGVLLSSLTGLVILAALLPSDKSLGYFRSSLAGLKQAYKRLYLP